MTYLHYQYCLSDFIIAEDYQLEYFTQEDTFDSEYQNLLFTIKAFKPTEIKKLDGLIRRVYVSKEEISNYLDEEKEVRTYNPLNDTPELYLEMNKIDIFDEKSLMKFIKNYGIPFNGQRIKDERNTMFDSILFQFNDTEKFLLGMDVLAFYSRLAAFQRVLKMWNDIVTDNHQELSKIVDEFKHSVELYDKHPTPFNDKFSTDEFSKLLLTEMGFGYIGGEIKDILQTYVNDPEKLLKLRDKAVELKSTWQQVKNEPSLATIAFAYLNLELKEIESGKTSTRFVNKKIVPALKFKNLIEVAGYQLKKAIFKNQRLEVCENCGALFEPKHASQKFCSPLPGRKRSTCENTYNQRLKRTRIKEKRQLERK